MQNTTRELKAASILEKQGITECEYLGQGFEGVVFHDNYYIYKVILPFFSGGNKWNTWRHLSFFLEQEQYCSFYQIEELIETEDGFLIEKYPYEKSEPVEYFTEEDCIFFLTECWQKKIIVQDCKRENFIRVNGCLKLIDMDACTYYSDNLFLNVCARMFLFVHQQNNPNLKKIQRSAINNFDLPELDGLREFVNRVFANIIYQEATKTISKIKFSRDDTFVYEEFSPEKLPNLEELFFHRLKEGKYLMDIQVDRIQLSRANTFLPERILLGFAKLIPYQEKVSLLIKTCAMEVGTIEQSIRHIVRQLSFPCSFHEIVVAVDSKREHFLRQYKQPETTDYEKLLSILERLENEGVISRFEVFNPDSARTINESWFNLSTDKTHSSTNVPISSQLFAFEQCQGEYILQVDSDVMIGRRDFNHNYLDDMIRELKGNDSVISVGFNICNAESKPYFGFSDGGFVPEVRMCLLDKNRLLQQRPLPNSLNQAGRLALTWYRSLEKHQKNTGCCSIRGGDNRTFFIHPQNYRKTEAYTWINILDRVEQLEIPTCQYNHFDCEGSFYDWCTPKRNEKMIILSCFRNITPDRFLRFWHSLMSQDFQDFGIILYDDCSDNGIPLFIEKMVAGQKHRTTLIKGRTRLPKIQSQHIILHNYCDNPDSIIACVDADDALIGSQALYDIFKKYEMWGVDVTCGRVHQTYRIQPHYRYPVDFRNPRSKGGNVWQHLKTFKKYLFDSIPLSSFLYEDSQSRLSESKWLEKCDDYAIMVPVVEMSSSPYQMDFINYFYERDFESRDSNRELKERCIAEVLQKKELSPKDVLYGRKIFPPCVEKIELDLTFDCNLKCLGCNRSCGQAPSKERMEIEDIHRFIRESKELGHHWKLINVLGGEPTLHPDFLDIMELLQEYADSENEGLIIQVVSNGFTEESRQLCKKAETFKNVRIDYNSFKTERQIDYFIPFADAPCDDPSFNNAEYYKACWVPSYCGIALNKNGYYGCSVCGAIDRVMGAKNGVSLLKELTEQQCRIHFEQFCSLCGNFKHYASNQGDFIPRNQKAPFREIISPTWKKLYEEYHNAH